MHYTFEFLSALFEASLLFVLLMGFVFLGGRALWYRRRVRSLLSKHAGGRPTLPEVQEFLMMVNAECSTHLFSVERFANILFREQTMSLVFGRVGSLGWGKIGPTWQTTKSLFAIAGAEQTPWMVANPDAFTPAFVGSQASVFWISIGKL